MRPRRPGVTGWKSLSEGPIEPDAHWVRCLATSLFRCQESGRRFQPLRKVRLHSLDRGLGVTRHHRGQDGTVFAQ